MLIEAVAIGLVYSFFLFEAFGVVGGGLIAPGYFALYLDQPVAIALCLGTAVATMLLIRALSYFAVIYGRRRFMLCVLLAFALQWTAASIFLGSELAQGRIEVIGYIIPGLVAHEMERQGIGLTLVALLLLTSLVYITILGLRCLRTF